MMKKAMLIFICNIIFFSLLLSMTNQWEENGRQIVDNQNMIAEKLTATSDGYTYIILSVVENGKRNYRVQKIDQNQNPMWGEFGVTFTFTNKIQKILKMKIFNENIFIIWEDNDRKFYAQKIDLNGNKMWGDYGICFSNQYYDEDLYIEFNVFPDFEGGIFIFWKVEYNNLTGIRLTSNGSWGEGWNSHGSIIFHNEFHYGYIIQNQDNFILTWESLQMETNQRTIYMQKLSFTNSFLWDNPKNLYHTDTEHLFYKVIKNSENNIFLIYRLQDTNNNHKIKVMYLDNDGNNIWVSPLNIENISPYIRNTVISSDDNLLVIINHYLLKISKNKQVLWQKYFYLPSYQPLYLIADNFGGAILTKLGNVNYRDNFKLISIQHYDSNGNELLGDHFCKITDTAFEHPVSLDFINNNQYQIAWYDYQNEVASVKCQIFDQNDNPVFPSGNQELLTSSVKDIDRFTSVVNFQNEPIYFWTQTINNSIYMTKMNENNWQPQNGIQITNNYFQLDNPNLQFQTVASAYRDEIAILAQTAMDSLLFKIVDSNGNTLFQHTISATDQYQKITNYHLYNKETNPSDSSYLIYWIERDQSSPNHLNHIIFVKYSNGELTQISNIYAGTYFTEYLHDDYLILRHENIIKVIGLDENYNISPDWPSESVILNGYPSNDEVTYIHFAKHNDNLILIYGLNNNLYLNEINRFGEILQENVSLIDNPANISIINFDDKFTIFYMINNERYVKTFLYENGEPISNSHEIYLLTAFHNVKFFFKNNFYYALVKYSEEKLLLYVFDQNYTNTDFLEIIDTLCNYQNPKYLFDSENNILVTWKDNRFFYNDEYFNYDFIKNSSSVFSQKISASLNSNTNHVPETVNKIFLYANYPNPFNPQTTISFNLPKNISSAKIVIYNLKGQKIKSFALSPNSKSIAWDGKDNLGKSVSSGIYFYRLVVDGKGVDSKKCVLLK